MTTYVIRHGQKAKGDFFRTGLPLNDEPLSETGRAQALALTRYFKDLEIDSITVSEYRRTMETIAPVAEMKHIRPVTDSRLNEFNAGDAAALTEDELEKVYPELWKDFVARESDFRFLNGESGEEAGERVYGMFCSLDPAQNHILVAHDGIIRTLICRGLGLPVYKRHLFRIDPCSITIFEYSRLFSCWTVPKINMVL